jgi:peptide/nickel transport system permease protein
MENALFVTRRVAYLVLTLLAVSAMIFTITQLLPGDVATMILGMSATPEDLVTLRRKLGLDRPVLMQYFLWLGNFLRGDLGVSNRFGLPVADLLADRLRNSAILGGIGLLIAVPAGLVLGVFAGLRPGRPLDVAASSATLFAIAMPEFVTSAVLIIVFSTWLGWFPPFSSIEPGMGLIRTVQALLLPAVALSFGILAYILRMVRIGTIEVMDSPFVRTAILKGMPRRTVVIRHALPTALGPAITVVALCLGWVAGGLVIVESMFGFPGLGRLLLFAIQSRDVPLIQPISLIIAGIYAIGNMLADIAQRVLDPRTRHG